MPPLFQETCAKSEKKTGFPVAPGTIQLPKISSLGGFENLEAYLTPCAFNIPTQKASSVPSFFSSGSKDPFTLECN